MPEIRKPYKERTHTKGLLIPGKRPILAQTCGSCGVFLMGDKFARQHGYTIRTCNSCRDFMARGITPRPVYGKEKQEVIDRLADLQEQITSIQKEISELSAIIVRPH